MRMKIPVYKTWALTLLVTLTIGGVTQAAVKPHGLFTDGAVLQQGIEAPVWGTANDGEKITVKFQVQEVSTVAKDGRWMVKLKPLKPGGPFTMTITGENTVVVNDLLVGEVWVCSGQSNMHFPLKQATTGAAALAACRDSELRLCTVPNAGGPEPLRDVAVQWTECSPTNAADFSAVGYFFGRDLRRARKVPVGLIHASVGGTGVQFWMSWRGIEANPAFHAWVDAGKAAEIKYQAALAKYEQQPWTNTPPKRVERTIGKVYNGMIAPLQPYGIRGVIWFQGESNSTTAQAYTGWFLEMLRGWRADWGIGDFPFLVGQLGPFVTPEIREAQLVCWQKSTNTAMIVSVDCSEGAKEVHFPKKEPVGVRLALAARAVAYGEKVEYSGPIYDSLNIDGNRAILSFKHTGTGLEARDALKGFTIAGADKKFVAATAKIDGDRVVVSSPEVTQPVAVRYGWSTAPELSLYNKNGLPSSPFRTDIP
ncbi:MAG: sialate O-acetylesterase [Verrucomicrobiota bacterium]